MRERSRTKANAAVQWTVGRVLDYVVVDASVFEEGAGLGVARPPWLLSRPNSGDFGYLVPTGWKGCGCGLSVW